MLERLRIEQRERARGAREFDGGHAANCKATGVSVTVRMLSVVVQLQNFRQVVGKFGVLFNLL